MSGPKTMKMRTVSPQHACRPKKPSKLTLLILLQPRTIMQRTIQMRRSTQRTSIIGQRTSTVPATLRTLRSTTSEKTRSPWTTTERTAESLMLFAHALGLDPLLRSDNANRRAV